MACWEADEVCFLCGVTPNGPSKLTTKDLDGTVSNLVDALLEHFPDILSTTTNIETRSDLIRLLMTILEETTPDDLENLSKAFQDCTAIGYFDDDGDTPREAVRDSITKFRFPDGQFVKTRLVDDVHGGEFWQELVRVPNPNTGEMEEFKEINMSRTSAAFQEGFGNFFLSTCCLAFLEGWIDRTRLPPMWDGRHLSFVGELWEIVNSRETGRHDGGWLEWLEPGGAERKLDQTQYYLSVYDEEIYPAKTANALRNGLNDKQIMEAVYDDYGYWMFITPHDWPHAPADRENILELSTLGFEVPTRATHSSMTFGPLARLQSEILVQVFGRLPDVTTYLNLKLVSKRLHDLISDAKFTCMVLREMLNPDPMQGMFWVYPTENQPEESQNFRDALKSWFAITSTSGAEIDTVQEDVLFHHEFPLIQFVHALYGGNSSRNRKRLWKTVKNLEDVWIDYRINGWKVNRFGEPYPESHKK